MFITTSKKINSDYPCRIKKFVAYLHPQNGISGMRQNDFVAQLVEQLTLNQWAEGSSPSEVTKNKPLTKVSGFLFDWIYLLLNLFEPIER